MIVKWQIPFQQEETMLGNVEDDLADDLVLSATVRSLHGSFTSVLLWRE